jgi:arsenite methyltransferase
MKILISLIAAVMFSSGGLLSPPTEASEPAHAHPAHRSFDDPASYAKSWENPERDTWQRPADIIARLDVQRGMKVADIGTGTGYLIPYLSRAVGAEGQVMAVDISPAMLEWVKNRARRDGLSNVSTVQASGASTALPPESIQRAVMINVWHHIEDQVAYAKDLHAAMQGGGVLFIIETRPDADQEGGPPMHFRLKPESVIAQLEKAGFRAKLDPLQIDRQYVVRAER